MTKSLFVAWRSSDSIGGRWGPVGRLDFTETHLFRFAYTRGATMLAGFHPFPGMDSLNEIYESKELFPLFFNRLLSKKRPEYTPFLLWCGFETPTPDPLSILGVTEGLRATDTIEVFPCPYPDSRGRYRNQFFLHGVQYLPPDAQQRIERLHPGDSLGFMFDVSNRHDSYAIAVRTCDDEGRYVIGYLPRYLARNLWELFRGLGREGMNRIPLTVARINPGAPMQQRVLCRMEADWPQGFQPCAGEEFLLLANQPDNTTRAVGAAHA